MRKSTNIAKLSKSIMRMDGIDKRHALRDLIEIEYLQAENNLYHFFESAWNIVEPNNKLLKNWHQELICEYLTACYKREIKRLIINLPPRYSKSLLASVMFPSWVWARCPEERFMIASYNYSLAIKNGLKMRLILQDSWYRNRWDGYKLTRNNDNEVKNSREGHVLITSLDGSATGLGGNFIIVDDPHDVTKAQSDKIREHDLERFDQKISTRLDDKKNGVIMIIAQRCHKTDLTGHILKNIKNYEILKIPAESPNKKTYIFPISKKKKIFNKNELLHKKRENKTVLDDMKTQLSTYGYNSQYLQEPVSPEGNIIKVIWIQRYSVIPDKFDMIYDAWDLAVKDKITSDFIAGVIFGVVGALKYILHVTKKKAGFADSIKAIKLHRDRYPEIDRTIIEDKANGSPVLEVIRKEIPGVLPYVPKYDKIVRLRTCEPEFEAGQILFPIDDIATFDVKDFITSLTSFPNGDSDDDVDATSCGINYYRHTFKNIHIS